MQMTPIVTRVIIASCDETRKRERKMRHASNERTKIARGQTATGACSAVQLLPDRTCEGDGVGAERARGGQGVPVLAVAGRVSEERLGWGGEGQEAEAAAAAGVGEGDVERGRERGEEVE